MQYGLLKNGAQPPASTLQPPASSLPLERFSLTPRRKPPIPEILPVFLGVFLEEQGQYGFYL